MMSRGQQRGDDARARARAIAARFSGSAPIAILHLVIGRAGISNARPAPRIKAAESSAREGRIERPLRSSVLFDNETLYDRHMQVIPIIVARVIRARGEPVISISLAFKRTVLVKLASAILMRRLWRVIDDQAQARERSLAHPWRPTEIEYRGRFERTTPSSDL